MSKHFIYDEIYGYFEIEKVLYELINSDAIKRLEKVHQGGGSFLVNKKWNVNRKQHSIGVMLIMRILGRNINEQILGLLHDVSHTAFSHVIDYVLDNKEENFHEKIYNDIIESSDIPEILSKNNINYKDILNINSTVLDYPIPDLCADRIDYTIRDMYSCGYLNKKDINNIINSLIVIDNKIYFNDINTGKLFTKLYIKEVTEYFMHPLNIFSNFKLAKVLKIALNENIISIDDFKLNDFELLDKLCLDNNLSNLIKSINSNVRVVVDEKDFNIHKVLKPRIVNPIIVNKNNEFIRVSELDDEIKLLIESSIDKIKKGVYLREIIN